MVIRARPPLLCKFKKRRVRCVFLFAVRKIFTNGTVVTIAGNGTAGSSSTLLRNPKGVAVNPTNDDVYVADTGNHCIKKIGADGIMTVVAGICGKAGDVNGALGTNKIHMPMSMLFSKNGSTLYFSDYNNHRVKRMVMSSSSVSSVIGNGTAGCTSTQLDSPVGLSFRPDEYYMYIACSGEMEMANFSAYMPVTAPGSASDT